MSFFQDFAVLQQKVPRIGLQCVDNENSPYCQYTEKSKNCYMTFASYGSEDCLYNTRVLDCTDCVDCLLCQKCELCYECSDCIGCYNCAFCDHCEQAIDSAHCYYCFGVQNCFGCIGLSKKQYCIYNIQYSKEEYFSHLAELKKMAPMNVGAQMASLLETTPRPAMTGKNNEGVMGDHTHQSKNCFWAFDSKGLQDCNFVYHCDDSKNLLDCSHLGWSELCYEVMSGGNLNNCMFCFGCWNSQNLEYCELMHNSHDCFGCIGMNHAQYAILNVAYPKEEYFRRVEEIKAGMKSDGSWGTWFETTYPEVLTYGI